MVLMCQRDSFLKELTDVVVERCDAKDFSLVVGGKTVKKKGYAVTLNDTIIFPEGGGQPSDVGQIGEVKVLSAQRMGDSVFHYTQHPLPVGESFTVTIDWNRRFDHMQQHSGQHLLSAILEREFGLKTTAWWLGETECHVELDTLTTKVSPDLLPKVEARCNALIREALPVTVTLCQKDDPSLDQAHTRGLPPDHQGPVRMISIAGVDDNLCCGTHVTNLSQLQIISLLGSEPGKKNKTNVKFLVGDRVLGRLHICLQRENTLTKLLNNEASSHADLVEKLQLGVKSLRKSESAIVDELCERLVSGGGEGRPLILHRPPHTTDPSPVLPGLARCLQAITPPPPLALLTQQDAKGYGGQLLLIGEEEHVVVLAPKICELVKGKGGGKGGRYQAKGTDFKNLDKCDRLIEEYFAKLII